MTKRSSALDMSIHTEYGSPWSEKSRENARVRDRHHLPYAFFGLGRAFCRASTSAASGEDSNSKKIED